MDLSQYGELFLTEAREHVSQINNHLLSLEADPGDRAAVEEVFRSVHTIKGMAATLGFQAVTDLAHELENVLQLVREDRLAPQADLLDLLFTAVDALEASVDAAVDASRPVPEALGIVLSGLRAAAADVSGGGRGAGPSPRTGALESGGPDGDGDAGFRLEVRMAEDSPLPGGRAFIALRRLEEVGEVVGLEPAEEVIRSEEFAGRFRFTIRTDRPLEEIRAIVRSAGEVAEVRPVEEGAASVGADETDLRAGALAGDVLSAPGDTGVDRVRSIRVDLDRLDALTNQVGELVILRDRLRRLADERDLEAVDEALEQAGRLISNLQAEVMNARMVPVWQVLDRFPRLVRDAGRALGKRVRLEMSGREIEFDRSMLDEIGDPLVHLLRNAVDHGIESGEVRLRRGKPEIGKIRIDVAREHSRVVVRVRDDGGGIDRARVLAKAVERGLVSEEGADSLADEEVFRFLTSPGFSTATEITDVSGRGVGLDVVATRVRSLGGTFSIQSEPGEGSTFTIRLPLTLAIVRALMIASAGQAYAIPLSHVAETDEVDRAGIRLVSGREVAVVRGDPLPLVRLRRLLGAQDHDDPIASIVVVEAGDQRVGVVVDRLLGQREVVVKGFNATVGTEKLFSGATILADGRPALILDAGSLTGLPTAQGGLTSTAR